MRGRAQKSGDAEREDNVVERGEAAAQAERAQVREHAEVDRPGDERGVCRFGEASARRGAERVGIHTAKVGELGNVERLECRSYALHKCPRSRDLLVVAHPHAQRAQPRERCAAAEECGYHARRVVLCEALQAQRRFPRRRIQVRRWVDVHKAEVRQPCAARDICGQHAIHALQCERA